MTANKLRVTRCFIEMDFRENKVEMYEGQAISKNLNTMVTQARQSSISVASLACAQESHFPDFTSRMDSLIHGRIDSLALSDRGSLFPCELVTSARPRS